MFILIYTGGCNQGCPFCKFNSSVSEPIKNEFIPELYKDKKVLLSYSTEPLPFEDSEWTAYVIDELHKQNASILFLSRRPERIVKILPHFNKTDLIGCSVSENLSTQNIFTVLDFLKQAREKNLKTWVSLEPVLTENFAKSMIDLLKTEADFIRVGKLDSEKDNIKEWDKIRNTLTNKYKTEKGIIIK